MNYKIRVANEAESKQVQELFFELGAKWKSQLNRCSEASVINVGFPSIFLYGDSMALNWRSIEHFNEDTNFKEITIPELKDMVVLKRNNPKDSTHYRGDGKEYFQTHDKERYYHFQDGGWVLSTWMNYQLLPQLKPITKKPIMKEFLNPDQGYKLVCCAIGGTSIPENWIEVPQGATSYNQYTRGESDNEFFIKLVGDTYCFANEDTSYTWEWYGGSLKGHEFVLWQRETLNDKVASAEVARQSGVFVCAPFSDLPEFNFEAVDVAYGVGFDQDNVNQPSHYCSHPSGIECIEITRHHDFAIGNAIKYLWRAGLKDSADEIQDLEKASWYIQDKINQLKKLNGNP